MNDHEHDFWRTPAGGLVCACGKSKAPALAPSAAEQAEIDRFGIFEGFWNGLSTEVERGTAIVADAPEFPQFWARTEGIIGQRIAVVRVVLDGVNYGGGTTYLDDREGQGRAKVTGGGSPRAGHAELPIEPGSFEGTI